MTIVELKNLDEVTEAIRAVAAAVVPPGNQVARDDTGGFVGSLTEAVMGISAGLVRVAEAMDNVAEAIRESRQP